MPGSKTREQQRRMFEKKGDLPDSRQMEAALARAEVDRTTSRPVNPQARQSEFAVSQHGVNQESHHNKHNDGGQAGHKPQQHGRAEEGK